ncbi:photosystem II repair protein Psb32 [Calothrix sp. 336/3]|uniref:photosystem II repair protein Psb32 n=1 Tax=Calothrix sp. 336/3 TaxID=1337936 RepID=UPI0004E3E825|nr:TPM domain-containing protein [Calothrix sp. 336/3]AKG24038.1 beta-propeller domain-containing protein, methanol dehydrogenase [Calothrix sp. 336/3]
MNKLLNQMLNWQKYLQRLMLPLLAMVITSSLWAIPAGATGVYQLPDFTADTWIVDQGEVISRLNEGKISDDLANLASKTGKEVRFVTIRRLDYGETPESFTQELFKKWFPTPEAQANQALFMVDTLTNGTTLVTGEEIKSVMSDEIANSIAQETFLAPLRDGNKYNQAFLDASDRLSKVLSGEPDPGPPQIIDKVQVERTFKKAEETDQGSAIAWVVGLLIAATVIPMATYYLYQVNQPSSDG